jgi:hypothetical protein
MVQVGDRYNWLIQTNLLLYPYAKIPLADWVQKAIKTPGEEFELAVPQ